MVRVTFPLFFVTAVFFSSAGAERQLPSAQPTLGAIRWDGWFDGNTWEKNLVSPDWRYRLPFYATVSDTGAVRVCDDSQETMGREIAYAKAGGIDYWAFCYYHPKSWDEADKYNHAWRRYLASTHKGDIHFCLLLQGGQHLGPANEWDATVAQFVGMFKEPAYQRVSGNRPLVYVFSCENLIPHFGSAEAAGNAFARFRKASVDAGAGDPYIVAQIWPHQVKADFLSAVKFDALGAYSAPGGKGDKEPYSKLVESNRWYWDTFKSAGREVVPLVNAGWDGRPRNYTGVWYEHATPGEVAGAVKTAFDWVNENGKTTPARTVLVYAWNEFDEGGWICPTKEAGPARLDAINQMRKAYEH
jgi:hypothetical protein